jgi:acylphosphatase
VQGVGFRFFAHRLAEQLGVRGWVRNLPDGSVEALCEGSERQIDELVASLRSGPPHASVSDLELHEYADDTALAAFEIR